MEKTLSILIIVEKGYLEKQALLLVRSIRSNSGKFSQSPIYAYSPRNNHPSRSTIKSLEKLGVTFVFRELNLKFKSYGFGNKPYVCQYAEESIQSDFLLFLDCDQIVLNEIDLDLISMDDIGLCSVEQKKVGGSPFVRDSYFDYWSQVYDYFNTKTDDTIETIIDQVKIFPYFNAGFILVRNHRGICQKWKDIFEEMMERKMFPGAVTFMDQVSLSVAIIKFHFSYQTLPSNYNYPLNLHSEHPNQISLLDDIVTLHYHKSFATTLKRHPLDGFLDSRLREQIKMKLKTIGIYPIPRWKEFLRKAVSYVSK